MFTKEKNDYYNEVAKRLGLNSFWSDYSVDDLSAPHPFTRFSNLVYSEHWGGKRVSVPILGPTWEDIYVAADKCIEASGDRHHIFIEEFGIRDGELELLTGS